MSCGGHKIKILRTKNQKRTTKTKMKLSSKIIATLFSLSLLADTEASLRGSQARELSTPACVDTYDGLVSAIDSVAPDHSADLDNNIVRICPGSFISFAEPIVIGPKAVDIRCQQDANSAIVTDPTCILDGGSTSRGIQSFDEYSVALRGLVFQNFHSERTFDRAIYEERKEVGAALALNTRHASDIPRIPLVEIENCQFLSNSISIQDGASIEEIRSGGAAIKINEADEVRISGSTFDSNWSDSPVNFGAIIDIDFQVALVFEDLVFTNNTSPGAYTDRATDGQVMLGLISLYGYYSKTTEITRSLFANNRASPYGDEGQQPGCVIFLSENEDSMITENIFENNQGTPLFAEYGNSITLLTNTFANNIGYYGGGFRTLQPTTIDNNEFRRNTAVYGGAVFAGGDINRDADLEIPTEFLVRNSEFEHNSASSHGGSFYIEHTVPSPFEDNNVFEGNEAPLGALCDEIAIQEYSPGNPTNIDCFFSVGNHEYAQKVTFTNFDNTQLSLSVGEGANGPNTVQVSSISGDSEGIFITKRADCPTGVNPATAVEPYCLLLQHVDTGLYLYLNESDQVVASRMSLGSWVFQEQDCNGQSCFLLVNAETGLRLDLDTDDSLGTTDEYNDPNILHDQKWFMQTSV